MSDANSGSGGHDEPGERGGESDLSDVTGSGRDVGMDLDAYYRGAAAERIQELADQLLRLAREAERADAHDAALHLSDLSTQLLDLGVELAGDRHDLVDEADRRDAPSQGGRPAAR